MCDKSRRRGIWLKSIRVEIDKYDRLLIKQRGSYDVVVVERQDDKHELYLLLKKKFDS